jgi:hypothetical protein
MNKCVRRQSSHLFNSEIFVDILLGCQSADPPTLEILTHIVIGNQNPGRWLSNGDIFGWWISWSRGWSISMHDLFVYALLIPNIFRGLFQNLCAKYRGA